MPTVEDLGKRVKAKYPGTYDDLPDLEVGRRVQQKFPGSYDDFTDVTPATAAPTPAAPAATGPPVPAPPPRTTAGPIAFGAVQGLADVGGSVFDLPKTAFEYGLSYLPESVQHPIRYMVYGEEGRQLPPVSQLAERGAKTVLEKVGVPPEDLDPDTRTEQFIQRVVREVTGTVVALPAIRAVSATARAVPVARQLTGETVMATAQGVGAATAQQVAPDSLTAELVGQSVPVGALSLTKALARRLHGWGRTLFPTQDELRQQVTEALREAGGDLDLASRNVAKAVELQQQVPGFAPTLAEATGSPGLLTTQRSLRAADPTLAGQLTQRRTQNIDAVTESLDEIFQGGDVEDVRQSLAQTQQRVTARLEQRVSKAQARLEAVQETTQTRAQRAQARIDERVAAAQRAVREGTAQLAPTDVDALNAQERAATTARIYYERARRTFRSEARRLYENVDPDNVVSGPVGTLYDQVDDLEQRALTQFDQRDLPRSIAEFKRSVTARASRAAAPVQQALPMPSAAAADDQLELQQFIRRRGGINLSAETDIGPEFEALIRNRESGTTGLFKRTGGLTPQQMADAAMDAGFIFEGDKFELLDAIRESMKHGKTYSFRNANAFGDPLDAAYLGADATKVDAGDLRDVNVSLNDLQRLRSHILRDLRAQTGPDAGNKRRLLHSMRQAVEARMEGLAREQGRPDLLEDLQRANQFYRDNITRFSTGAGERILRQRNGAYRVSNAQVIREFLRTPEDAQQFVAGIGSRADALAALETYLDSELYLKAVHPETGRLSTSQAQRFLRERHPMLRLFPELQERYSNVAALEARARRVEEAARRLSQRASRRVSESEELADAQERAAQAQASAQAQARQLAREPGQAILQNTLDNGGVAQIMQRADANRQLIRLAQTMENNPEARQGIAKAMWTEFVRREGARAGRDPISDNPMLSEKQLTNFLTRYSGALTHIYGAEHVANLKKVAEGLRIARAADRPPVQLGSPTAELLQGRGTFLRGAARAAFPMAMPLASLKGRMLRFAVREVGGFIRSRNEAQLEKLTREMLFDSDISKTMALLRQPKQAKAAATRLKAHFIMLGAENRFDDPEGDGE